MYSYTQFAPLVNTGQYGEITVTVDVDHILGNGKPTFVEIQYKVSGGSLTQQLVEKCFKASS